MSRRNATEAVTLPRGTGKPLSEIGKGDAIEVEPITGSLAMSGVDLEKFMHEEVVVYVHPSREAGSLEVIPPNVNGINQPIIRGVNTPVKRKYVEALRRAHSITYEQKVQDPSRPENIQMLARAIPDYPFDVIEDSAKGKAWLKHIDEQIQDEARRA